MSQAPKRTTRREIAAAATRQEILDAARRLFASQGFGATSIQQIAEAAGVAVQTIYSSVGPKAALVVALNDLIDEEAGVREIGRALATTDDPRALIERVVLLTRQINERCGDIVRAAVSAANDDPDAAATLQDGLRRHRDGAARAAARLEALGALGAGNGCDPGRRGALGDDRAGNMDRAGRRRGMDLRRRGAVADRFPAHAAPRRRPDARLTARSTDPERAGTVTGCRPCGRTCCSS